MGFTLHSQTEDEKRYVNVWHWRCTLGILRRARLLDDGTARQMGLQVSHPVSAQLAGHIADYLDAYLANLSPDARVLQDGTVVAEQVRANYDLGDPMWAYSTDYAWLDDFRTFSRRSGGFTVD